MSGTYEKVHPHTQMNNQARRILELPNGVTCHTIKTEGKQAGLVSILREFKFSRIPNS